MYIPAISKPTNDVINSISDSVILAPRVIHYVINMYIFVIDKHGGFLC